MEFNTVYTVKKEIEKETFLRELLIQLGTANGTPVDVVNAEFKAVEETVKEVIVCSAHVEGNCTASIGYDRQEAYIDYETYKEKVGNTYITRQRPVTKYKTVTDWQLFQTQYAGEATCAALNADRQPYSDSDIILAIKSARADNIVVKGEAEVNSSGLAKAVSACETNVELSTVLFPGDRHKDVRYNSKSTIQRISCYKLPFYEVTYTYNDKDYCASCFACGTINISTQTPPNDVNITAMVKQKTEDLAKAMSKTWKFFVVALLAAFAVCFGLKFPWLFPVPIVLLVKAMKDTARHREKYEEYSEYYSKNIGQAKVLALKEALETRGFEPMSESRSAELENYTVPGAAELKAKHGRVIFSWLLVVILTIFSFFVYKGNLHSPKHVDIEVAGMAQRYDPEASPYINGCYYVELQYEIKAKRVGVEYIDLKVHITDKKGNEIGTVKSSLSDINAEKGKKTVIKTTLEENKPEENALFTALYEGELSDFRFEFEIGSISFSDGEHYYNDEYNQFG